jgi:hypothetical protein
MMTTWQREKMMEVMKDYKETRNPVEISVSADGLSWVYDFEDNEEYAQLARKLKRVYEIILNKKLDLLNEPKRCGVSFDQQEKMMAMTW